MSKPTIVQNLRITADEYLTQLATLHEVSKVDMLSLLVYGAYCAGYRFTHQLIDLGRYVEAYPETNEPLTHGTARFQIWENLSSLSKEVSHANLDISKISSNIKENLNDER